VYHSKLHGNKTRRNEETMAASASNFIVRKCLPEDIKQVVDIYNYYISKPNDLTTFEEVEVTEDQIMERYNNTMTKKFPYIVAVDENNKVVGYAYGSLYGVRVSYRFSAEDSVYLHHDYTGKGIGSLLLGALLLELKAMGMKQVVAVLGIKEDNPASYAIHKKFGFKDVGIFKKIGFKYGKWVDRLHMQVDLDEI
jgi:L-amino acid N-acyltransferase YncA